MLGSGILLVLNPLIFRHALSHLEGVYRWGLLLLVVATIASFCRYGMRLGFISVSRDAERDLRAKLFARVQEQGQAFYDHHRVGDLMSRMVNDLALYREVLGPGIMYPVFFITFVVPALVALFWIEPVMAYVACIPVLVLPPIMLLARALLYRISLKVQSALGEMSTLAQEDYSGIRLIKSYGREQAFSLRFTGLAQKFLRLSVRVSAVQNLFFPLLGLVGKLVTVALIVVAAWVEPGADNVVSFMWLQSYILLPVLLLGWVLPLYQRGRGAYERLLAIYEEPLTVEEGGDGAFAQGAVEVRDLTFAYVNETPVLKGVSLRAGEGELVGITGPPASGKSTLLRLLVRDYEVPPNTIYIGGQAIHDFSLEELRSHIAVVEQEPFLFSRTIGENISLGRKGMEEAVRKASLRETIARLPKGYDTMVGERGVTLSGGQRQRVALARAFLSDAPILLLDDVFSALDTATAAAIFDELRGMDKTILLVTHRVPILQACDHLYYMVDGAVVEEGRPVALVKEEGHFAALVELEEMIHRRHA